MTRDLLPGHGGPLAWLSASCGYALRPCSRSVPASSPRGLGEKGRHTSAALPFTHGRAVKDSGSEYRGWGSTNFGSRCFKLLEFDSILSHWVQPLVTRLPRAPHHCVGFGRGRRGRSRAGPGALSCPLRPAAAGRLSPSGGAARSRLSADGSPWGPLAQTPTGHSHGPPGFALTPPGANQEHGGR